MASPGPHSSAGPALRNERPFLYPWNRRLRHLHGISLRNVYVTAPSSRPRTRTKTITDDEDAPYNRTSPAKRALQDETKALAQSRSFTNLVSAADTGPHEPHGGFQKSFTSYENNDSPPHRPGRGLRRRSTLHWASADPRARQSKLEDMVADRLATTWVSLHLPGSVDPIYISELVERSMNPSFAFFDLDDSGRHISRSDQCTIRVWAQTSRHDDYCLLIELDLNLRSLQFIGQSLETFHHPLPQNCVLLHLSDGIYTSFTDLPVENSGSVHPTSGSEGAATQPSSSFDALMQLANLDECIQDAINVRSQLEDEINRILSQTRLLDTRDERACELDGDPSQTAAALASESKRLRQLQKRRDELKDAVDGREDALIRGQAVNEQIQRTIKERSEACRTLETQLQAIDDDTTGQTRRICEALLSIFPIEPLKGRPLQFMIRGIHLPNSTYSDTNRDEIAAALGFTAQLVHQLALYLSTSMPYPLEPSGSASFVADPVSLGLSQRRYPLHPTSVPYKFEYGVYLLNKDIEFLMNRVGLRVLDIRHTLPNLKYLLYVLTAGKGALPTRKAGGFRGLLGSTGTPNLSRRPSDESARSLTAGVKGSGPEQDDRGMPNGAGEKELDDPFVTASPGPGKRTTLHAKTVK